MNKFTKLYSGSLEEAVTVMNRWSKNPVTLPKLKPVHEIRKVPQSIGRYAVYGKWVSK